MVLQLNWNNLTHIEVMKKYIINDHDKKATPEVQG